VRFDATRGSRVDWGGDLGCIGCRRYERKFTLLEKKIVLPRKSVVHPTQSPSYSPPTPPEAQLFFVKGSITMNIPSGSLTTMDNIY